MTEASRQLVAEAAALTGVEPPRLLEADAPTLQLADDEAPCLIALIGGKDVGKSSLVNALAGRAISTVTAYGRGTETAIAYVHAEEAAAVARLLEREAPGAHRVVAHGVDALRRRALLDLPDIDSVWDDHVALVRRVLRHTLHPVWVTSVEKYADAAPQRLLQRVAEGNDPANFLFVVNKADCLSDAAAPAELRDDFAERARRALRLDAAPRVFLVSAARPAEFDLPALQATLAAPRRATDLRDARALAARRQQASLAEWFDTLEFPRRLQRVRRLREQVADLTQERLASDALARWIRPMLEDEAWRRAAAGPVVAARLARWPIVSAIEWSLGPLLASWLPPPRPSSRTTPDTLDLPAAVQRTFAQLRLADAALASIPEQPRLWDEAPAVAAADDLRRRVDACLERQSETAVRRAAGRRWLAPARWLASVGALAWFALAQPALARLLDGGLTWTALPRLAVELVSVQHLLGAGAMLLVYFLGLWLLLRWSTQRRFARWLRAWNASDARDATLSLPAQVFEWVDALGAPIERHERRLGDLQARAARLGAADPRAA